MNEGLSGEIERGVVEILGGEGGSVDSGEAAVVAINAMRLNKLHAPPPLPSLTLLGQ